MVTPRSRPLANLAISATTPDEAQLINLWLSNFTPHHFFDR
jgi:hypothetical protein